jgi:hypothetical protein
MDPSIRLMVKICSLTPITINIASIEIIMETSKRRYLIYK